MFDLYDYITTVVGAVPAIEKVYRTHGLSTLDEMMADVRNNPACCVVVQEGADGRLNLRDRRLNTAYHNFWVLVRAKQNDNNSRMTAKSLAMQRGVQLIDRMRDDDSEFGQPSYGLDDENIQYGEVGPIGQNYYGYSFSFVVAQAIEKYNPYPDETYLAYADSVLTDDNDNHLTL